MKTNIKTYRVSGIYDCTVVSYEYDEESDEYEIQIPEGIPDDELEEVLQKKLERCIALDDEDISDIDIIKLEYELISDNIPPAEVMRREGCKGLFDE